MFIENLNHNCEKSMWILDQKCSEVKGALRRRRRCLSRPPTFGGWRHGEGCLLPAAQKSDRRTFSTISGNSRGLPIHLLRGFGIFSNDFFSGISSSNFGLTRLVALYLWYVLKSLRWPPIQRLVDDHWLLLRKLLPGGKNSVFPTAVGKLCNQEMKSVNDYSSDYRL